MNKDKKDQPGNGNKGKNMNEGNKAPNIHPVKGQHVSEEKARAGKVGGIKPTQTTPPPGGRKGSTSVEDGGQDMGSSAGSR
ncbi:hypothetical protein [Botryobacter ruber]|uniref:hypothetical protein n=1 Tax=Botryobacter ruber TaxID=2171629 RepID=UPI000E0B1CF5|nr:hypothetical protein [Botryobacter ruber]